MATVLIFAWWNSDSRRIGRLLGRLEELVDKRPGEHDLTSLNKARLAGDLFASGFLHSHLSGRSLHDCVRIASLTGATIVQVLGAVVPKSLWPPLLQEVEGKLEA